MSPPVLPPLDCELLEVRFCLLHLDIFSALLRAPNKVSLQSVCSKISKSLMFLFEIYVLTLGLWVHVSLHFESPLSRLACGGRECFSVWSLQVTMEYRGTEQVVT